VLTWAGVAGWPVAHSRSPAMFAAAFEATGLGNWRYAALPLAPERFAETVRALPASGYRGLNVTIPHKEAALRLADEPTPAAAAIGAANSLTFEDGRIEADNTDAPGLLASLGQDLTLVTTHVSCDFLEEVSAFDEIVVRMTLAAVAGHRVSMRFEYWRTGSAGGERLVARGTQEIACMQRTAGQLHPVPLPAALALALSDYRPAGV